jgi:hypothetical protein
MRIYTFFFCDGIEQERRELKSLKIARYNLLYYARKPEYAEKELEIRVFAPPLVRFIKSMDPDPLGKDDFYYQGTLRLRPGKKGLRIVWEASERHKKKLI